jgi:formate hydrogenlyase transcriptional activator
MEKATFRPSATPHTVNGSNLDNSNPIDARQQDSPELRRFIDHVPALGWSALPDGSLEYANQHFRDYTGLSLGELNGSGWKSAVHRDDIQPLESWIQELIQSREASTMEVRLRRFDGSYRWFLVFANPLLDDSDSVVAWYGTNIDIDDRKQAEAILRARELSWRQIVDNIPGLVNTAGPTGAPEFFNRPEQEYFGKTNEELKDWGRVDVFHPDDLPSVVEAWATSLETGEILDIEARLRRADGVYRWFQTRAVPARDAEGKISDWYALHTDIEDRKRAEEALQSNERNLSLTINTMPVIAWSARPDGSLEFYNQCGLDYMGLSAEEARGWGWAAAIHPDDLNRLTDYWRAIRATGEAGEIEARLRRFNGEYRWFLIRACALRDESGAIVKWYGTNADIEDRKRAEEMLRQSEAELRTIIDTVRQVIVVLASDGTTLYANQVTLNLTGLSLDEAIEYGTFLRAVHPDDVDRLRTECQERLSRGDPFELEMRFRLKSGEYRWYLTQYNPLKDESGQIIRWYGAATDIDDQKRTEERLRNENIILREEIDRSSMFEEIVASCKPMRQVLKQVEKVAATDSTVLILGETGTGKELIAHALHRKSKRATRAFIRVNCAAIPQSLIASELFGHEKGAFTGALQRRLGRFEAADGGTLFLDEIGDLPMETQIALLRVLQEKEFERVGSNHPVSVDVRLIAATNRDLPAAVAAGTFRQDLFYRLNVVPIDVPPLRERVDDIPLLVEYFVGRFAKETGKNIRHIGKHTLEQLENYHWPGNIRELQNVVERAVVLCATETFVVEESWLKRESADSSRSNDGLSALADREVQMIEAALAETHGRISGPSGAAAKLGIPRQTLEYKIRRLGIDRYGQGRTASYGDN